MSDDDDLLSFFENDNDDLIIENKKNDDLKNQESNISHFNEVDSKINDKTPKDFKVIKDKNDIKEEEEGKIEDIPFLEEEELFETINDNNINKEVDLEKNTKKITNNYETLEKNEFYYNNLEEESNSNYLNQKKLDIDNVKEQNQNKEEEKLELINKEEVPKKIVLNKFLEETNNKEEEEEIKEIILNKNKE